MADTSFIKPDPDTKGASPAFLADDDIYEDAGDLEFNRDPAWQGLYLARVPKGVWEAWSKLDDDAEIELGTIRIANVVKPDGSPSVWPLPLPRISSSDSVVATSLHATKI
jgi:transcription initiation factor TFIIF subunit beta